MKRFLLILAVMVAVISAKAQDYQVSYRVDSLSYKELAADYVSLNNQVMNFRNCELASLGSGVLAAGFATASLFMENPLNAHAMYFAAGMAGVTSLVFHIVGLAKLKRDRLQVTPNGVIIKLTPQG